MLLFKITVVSFSWSVFRRFMSLKSEQPVFNMFCNERNVTPRGPRRHLQGVAKKD